MKYAAKTHTGRRRNAGQTGFTLLELLIVIALTAILIVLVFRPLIDSFNLASRAGTQIESQTAAREVLREVSGIIFDSEFIYDNTRPNATINIWLRDNNNNPIVSQLQFGMVDFVAPAHQSDQNVNPAGPTDPTTGEPILDPNAPPGKIAVSLPLAKGRLIERIFLALRDNRSGKDTHNVNAKGNTVPLQSGMPVDNANNYHGYANRWADPHLAGSPGNDNRYTLYRATFLANIQDPFKQQPYIPNLKLFHTGTNPNDPTSVTDKRTDQLIIEDPNFFYDNGLAGASDSKGDQKWAVPGWKDLVGDGKVYYWENWRAVATSMLQMNKADTIALDRDDKANVVYDVNGRPTARGLITFTPSYIENEAASPASMSATGAEVSYVAAATFSTQHGAWTTPFRVLVYQNNVKGDPTTVTGNDPQNQNPLTYYVYVVDPITGQSKIEYHEYDKTTNTDTLINGNVGPNIDANGIFQNKNPQYAFTVDAQRGIINFAFPQWVYTLKDNTGQPIRQQYHPADINSGVDPGALYGRRFLSLDDQNGSPPDQMTLGSPNSISPLAALFLNPVQNDPKTKPQRVHIVPGSEIVFGPDQRPGAHYGWSIQYTRVSADAGAIGANQYKINYDPIPNSTSVTDPNDPRARTGYIEFDSGADSSAYTDMPVVDPVTLTTLEDPDNGKFRAHGLPLVKATTSGQGTAQLGGYLASDPVLVQYNFQMNRANDVVKVDYLTRELMTVAINSRLYDPSSASPQDTVLTSQVKARNLQR